MQVWSAERVFVKNKFEKDWAVIIGDDGLIQAVGPRDKLVAGAKAIHHYPQSLILPSFINPHHHGFHTIFKGIIDLASNYAELLERLVWPLSQVIDLELFESLYWLAFADQLLSGVSTVGEFHYLHNGANSGNDLPEYAFPDKILEIAEKMGIRISLIYSLFDQGTRESTQAFVMPFEKTVEEFERLHAKYKDHPTINLIPGIHGLEHVTSKGIKAAAELAEKYDTKLHIQLAERKNELKVVQAQYGTTPVRALDRMGVLTDRMVVINGTLLDDDELQILNRKGVSCIVCPSASLAKGDGFPNMLGLLNHEITFCVGSDSVCMNNAFSVPNEIKWIEFTQRNRMKSVNVLPAHSDDFSLWDLGTTHSARTLGLECGELMPGSPADFMLVNLDGPNLRPRWRYKSEHFLNQLVFGWGPQVRMSHMVINGKLVIENGRLAIPDMDRHYRHIERWGEAFLKSLDKSQQDETQ